LVIEKSVEYITLKSKDLIMDKNLFKEKVVENISYGIIPVS